VQWLLVPEGVSECVLEIVTFVKEGDLLGAVTLVGATAGVPESSLASRSHSCYCIAR
jgi:hypothetical protein